MTVLMTGIFFVMVVGVRHVFMVKMQYRSMAVTTVMPDGLFWSLREILTPLGHFWIAERLFATDMV
jgi:hypothetical protein